MAARKSSSKYTSPASKPAPAASKSAPAPTNRRRIPFRVRLDGAREVILTGEFTGWATDRLRLQPGPQGEWMADLELAPGEYQCRLIVDGQWRDVPGLERRVPNPFGTENAVLVVR